MSWVKIDDHYSDHPKVVQVGPLGLALHVAATCYCARYLTDGFVPASVMSRLICFDGICNEHGNAVTNADVTKSLVEAGLLEETKGGYMVHDYLVYNPNADKVKEERKENAQRLADWRAKKAALDEEKKCNDVSNTVTNDVSNALPVPVPVPSNTEELNYIDDAAKPARPSRKKPTPEETALNAKAKSLIDEFIELSSLKPVSPADWGKWQKMAKYLAGYHVEPPDLRAAYYHERQYGKNPISWIGSIKARAISQHRE